MNDPAFHLVTEEGEIQCALTWLMRKRMNVEPTSILLVYVSIL